MIDLLYPLASIPLLSVALRCWARWARGKGGRGWLVVGTLLATFGIDALRDLMRRASESPNPWAGLTVAGLLGGLFLYLLIRMWRDLGRVSGAPRGEGAPCSSSLPGETEIGTGPHAAPLRGEDPPAT
jgi:hypothetical protein